MICCEHRNEEDVNMDKVGKESCSYGVVTIKLVFISLTCDPDRVSADQVSARNLNE
jgi:hypothetical protein